MDFSVILSSLEEKIGAYGTATTDAAMGDLTNPQELMKVQWAISNYHQMIQTESTLIKKVDDICSGIISKI